MLILGIVLVIAALIALAAVADRRARARRLRMGERYDDGATLAAGGTDAITQSRRAAAVNGGWGMPGGTLGTGE